MISLKYCGLADMFFIVYYFLSSCIAVFTVFSAFKFDETDEWYVVLLSFMNYQNIYFYTLFFFQIKDQGGLR